MNLWTSDLVYSLMQKMSAIGSIQKDGLLCHAQNLRPELFPLLFKCNTNHNNNPSYCTTVLEAVFIYLKLQSRTKENLHCLLPWNLNHKKKLQKSSAYTCHFPGISPHGCHHFHCHCPSRELRHGRQVPKPSGDFNENNSPIWWWKNQPTNQKNDANPQIWIIKQSPGGFFRFISG